MKHPPDPRIEEAKMLDVESVCDRLGLVRLRRVSGELSGPCPNCGGRDRFNIRLRDGLFLCRQCDVKGGDVIALVQQVESIGFPAALTWLCGDAPADPAKAAARERRARYDRAKRDDVAARKRAEAMAAALRIWREGRPAEGGPLRAYLSARGLPADVLPALPAALRCHPDLPYMERHPDRGWVELHRGPAMLAKMVRPDGSFGGVHRTWLDPAQPGGKIRKALPNDWPGHAGEALAAKKTLGSKRGGTIRLSVDPSADVMVVGEGIETTLTAMVSGVFPAATWVCAIDLGNMAGDRVAVQGKTGKPSKRLSEVPDMTDTRAFVPPDWVRRLIFIQDGDSEPGFTRACLVAGLRRAQAFRPGISCQIWPAPRGQDLNDVLLEVAP